MAGKVKSAHVSEIEPLLDSDPGEAEWKAVRHYFGITSFGTNAYVAREEGEQVVGMHTEVDTDHEELFFVASGLATFTVDGEEVDAPAGTFVFVRDPAAERGAVAREAGTTVLAFGASPGAFTVSAWERKYTGE